MKRFFIGLTLFFLVQPFCAGQDDFKKAFEDFKRSAVNEYSCFADSAKVEFARILERQWEQFVVFSGDSRLKMKTPVPVCPDSLKVPKKDMDVDISGVPLNEAVPMISETESVRLFQINPDWESVVTKDIDFEFCEAKIRVSVPTVYDSFVLDGVSEKAVSQLWAQFENNDITKLLCNITKYQSRLNLNDWGIYDLVSKMSESLFAFDKRLSSIFTVFVMNRLGLDFRIARAGNSLIPIFSAKQAVYSRNYIEMDGSKYYLPVEYTRKYSNIYTYRTLPYARFEPLDLKIKSAPVFSSRFEEYEWHSSILGKNFYIPLCQGLREFYDSYPQSDIDIYALCAPAESMYRAIVDRFTSRFAGLSPLESITLLLKIMHDDFCYMTDIEQLGYEKVFFVEENFCHSFNDCEDRAVLFSFLVRKLTGLQTVIVEYSDHVNCAVAIPDVEKGMHIRINGTKYYVCDPTYIGAGVGMSPKSADVKPQRIWML